MSSVLQRLDNLYEYYRGSRGSGHTRLLNSGVKKVDKFILAAGNEASGRQVLSELGLINKDRIPIFSWESLNHHYDAYSVPMAIDNHFMLRMLEDTTEEIRSKDVVISDAILQSAHDQYEIANYSSYIDELELRIIRQNRIITCQGNDLILIKKSLAWLFVILLTISIAIL